MKVPADLYRASTRRYDGLPDLDLSDHDRDVVVTACGRLCLHRKKINISTVLAGQKLGIKEVDEGIWLASFMHYDLGYFDLEQKDLATPRQPVRHEVATHVLEPIREVLELYESDVIHCWVLDSRRSAPCGPPNIDALQTAMAFGTRVI